MISESRLISKSYKLVELLSQIWNISNSRRIEGIECEQEEDNEVNIMMEKFRERAKDGTEEQAINRIVD